LATTKNRTVLVEQMGAGWPKNWHLFVRFTISSNIDRISKCFHCQNQAKICDNTISKDPTTPQMVATLPCEMSMS